MKKMIMFSCVVAGLTGCALFGGGSTPDPVATKPPKELGVFHPGPYVYIGDDGAEHICNAGPNGTGGYCESDNHCHSVKEKCLAQ